MAAKPPRFLDAGEGETLEALAALADANPFLPERVEAERRVLGRDFSPTADAWHAGAGDEGANPNLDRIAEKAAALCETLAGRLAAGTKPTREERERYELLVFYVLYSRFENDLWERIGRDADGGRASKVPFFEGFAAELRRLLPGDVATVDAAHLFALGFQVRRAFHFTFRQIYGGSMPAARLRAAVWESIFTRDRRRYRRALYERMADVTTLVLGESGTGKELVANAIALSRYVPFDAASRTFRGAASFHAVNLSALSPTLIESELFGHRRGAFTGALDDRAGYLESCPATGSVFLDEIGELGGEVQVKLLRVLQARTFQRIGETRERPFAGKVIAATNRDLEAGMRAGRFRADLYYRLCADVVVTPTLRDQLADSPADLANLLTVLARRIAGDEEAPRLADEAATWIHRNLGADYPWPGNIRELEQCVRNILVRGAYRPADARPREDDDPFAAARAGTLTADELLDRYCAHVHAMTGSYVETGRRLALDRRTVRARVESARRKRGSGLES